MATDHAELGVLTGPDVELLESITGGTPLGFYSNLTRWSQLRSRMVDEMNNDLIRKTNWGDLNKKFTFPAVEEFKAPTRETAVTKYRTLVGGDPDERIKWFGIAETATERERDTKVGARSQASAEANSYIETVGPRNLDRLQKDFNKAVKAGDDEKADEIDDKITREETFIFKLKQERTRLGRDVSEFDVVKETELKAEERLAEERRIFVGK